MKWHALLSYKLSYFLETLLKILRKIRQNPHLTRSIAGNFGDTKETAEDHPVNGK